MEPIKVVELFAGVGGFRIGLERASDRFRVVWSNQWEPGVKRQAASDVYAPVAGRVVESNAALAGDEGLVNREPMGGGWFFRLSGVEEATIAGLMDEAGYAACLEGIA